MANDESRNGGGKTASDADSAPAPTFYISSKEDASIMPRGSKYERRPFTSHMSR